MTKRSLSAPVLKTEEELRAELSEVITRFSSQTEAAASFGISRSHLSKVLHGEKRIVGKIVHAMGYERVFRFEKRRG